jgi:two-component system, NtrC family, sensor histidine kinase HydH
MQTTPGNAGMGSEGFGLKDVLQDYFACGVLTVDSGGRIIAQTPLAEELLHLPESSNSASPAPLVPAPIHAVLQEVYASGQAVVDREITLEINDGPGVALDVTAIPVTPGKPVGNVVVLLKDVSLTRKLEHHMRRLDRLASIGTLAASMAHEIKNALVPIKTFVELLLEKYPETELADTVRREMNRVNSIVSRMLKFSAPTKPALCALRLHELLEHSLRMVQHRVEGRMISFVRHFNASSDAFNGDDHQLEQAFLNLLLNAVDAMGAEGALTVSTEVVAGDDLKPPPGVNHTSRFLRIRIADTGMGIAPENLQTIFEPFFTTKQSGTGLGLAVTLQIIQEHHGRIDVESQPGKGTTFTVLLPADAAGARS